MQQLGLRHREQSQGAAQGAPGPAGHTGSSVTWEQDFDSEAWNKSLQLTAHNLKSFPQVAIMPKLKVNQ